MRGFSIKSTITASGVLILILWYAVAVAIARTGATIGRQFPPLDNLNIPRSSPRGAKSDELTYRILSCIALIGVLYSAKVISGRIGIISALTQHQANLLYEALPDGFGLQTLRYASSVTAAIGIHRMMERRRPELLGVLNVLLLSGTALLASRLSLFLATVSLLFLVLKRNPTFRIRLSGIALVALGLFLLLLPLSFSRVASYYEARGVSHPVTVDLAQIWAYLDTPAQVSVGVASAISSGQFGAIGNLSSAERAIQPTYTQRTKPDKNAPTDPGLYGYTADVLPYYNTNSVFADTLAREGLAGLLGVLSCYLMAGFLYGHFAEYESHVSLIAALMLYGFSETWRVFLFNAGIMHFLVIMLAASQVIAAYGSRHSRLRRPHRVN